MLLEVFLSISFIAQTRNALTLDLKMELLLSEWIH